MKIVNIILTSENGGVEQVFIDYLQVLEKLGHEVLAITKDDAPYAKMVEDLGIQVKKIKNNLGYYDIFAVSNIKNILLEFNADAVVAHAGRAIFLARKAAKKISKKILIVAVNHSLNVKRSIGSDAILSVNKRIFFKTVDSGQSENSSFVIHNAIDLAGAVNELNPINLKEKKIIKIGLMARFDRTKGFTYAIKSIKNLTKISDKKFILKIAGTGYYENELRNLVKELQLEEHVEFCGWVKDKKEFFNSIDIFCLPSEEETFGLVLLEAMKYGKPIIATNTDGAKEILQNRKDSLVVDIEPLQSLDSRISDAVIEMIDDSNLVNLMVKNAAIKVREKFSYEALEGRMREVFGNRIS
ncbi:MAG: glycosyltransferase family 4 protein [Rickettsiales bacterium]|nr:glycosyltransferase family 4 protein [Rickettsiales bacterium]